jgi:hypothetical protein
MRPFGQTRASRQLQHRGMLARTQACQQNHLKAEGACISPSSLSIRDIPLTSQEDIHYAFPKTRN